MIYVQELDSIIETELDSIIESIAKKYDEDIEAIYIYFDLEGITEVNIDSFDYDEFSFAYCGKFDSEKDFAEYLYTEYQERLFKVNGKMLGTECIDWEIVAKELFKKDYYYDNQYVFRIK